MTDWNEQTPYGRETSWERELGDENRHTLRQLVVRLVALIILFSLLGSSFLWLRGIENILIVVGILGVVALVGFMVRKQRAAENPYRSDDPTDYEIH